MENLDEFQEQIQREIQVTDRPPQLSLPTKLSFAGAKKNTMGVFLTSRTCPTIVVTQRNAKLSQKELSKNQFLK